MTGPVSLALLAGQPLPAQVPTYQRVSADPRVDLTVFYGSSDGLTAHDGGYGIPVAWDSDLLTGYRSQFLDAADRTPGLGTHFLAARNYDIVPRLLRGRYDVLWMAGYFSATYVMAAAAQRVRGGAVLFREEQTTLDRRSPLNTIAKQLIVRPYLACGYGLYISHENRRWLESLGVPDERLFPAPYTVDNAGFRAQAEQLTPRRSELRAAFGIAPDAGPVVLCVCRLIDKKQPKLLLEAFRRVRAENRATLLVVGAGPLEAELRAQIARDEIRDVVLAGFLNQSEIPRAYAVADVFTLLSGYQETFGLSVNEAMNFGLPIVASDRVGCAADLVWPGSNGFIVDARSAEAAAKAIGRLVADPNLAHRMGAASARRIADWGPAQAAEGIVTAALAADAARRGASR